MEFYHHMGLHAVTLETDMSARRGRMDPAPPSGRFIHTHCGCSEEALSKPEGFGHQSRPGCSFTELEETTSYAIGLFPNISLAMSTATLSWLSFIPMGPERTRVVGGFIVAPEMAAAAVMAASNDLVYAVNEEDGLPPGACSRSCARPRPRRVRPTCARGSVPSSTDTSAGLWHPTAS